MIRRLRDSDPQAVLLWFCILLALLPALFLIIPIVATSAAIHTLWRSL